MNRNKPTPVLPYTLPGEVVNGDVTPDRTTIIPAEDFIRRVFETDPKQGCTILFRHYYPVLCSHAARFVYSKSIAEDIVTEVFEVFWSRKGFLTVNTSYRSYLYRAVRNTCINYLQREFRKNRYVELASVENESCPELSPLQNINFDEMTKLIDATIQGLAPKCQSVFVMSRFEGLKNKDIANQLGITEKAVEAHITKALTRLRMALKAYL